eukprot:1152173-Pelagomonas_calceolata.AAC.3
MAVEGLHLQVGYVASVVHALKSSLQQDEKTHVRTRVYVCACVSISRMQQQLAPRAYRALVPHCTRTCYPSLNKWHLGLAGRLLRDARFTMSGQQSVRAQQALLCGHRQLP